MRPGLKAIRIADSEAILQEAWREFQESFPSAKKLIAYIKTWMQPDRLVKWALYHREVFLLSLYSLLFLSIMRHKCDSTDNTARFYFYVVRTTSI